jgi:predicted adenylyl cyclase CyaB
MPVNVEIKAKCADQKFVEDKLKELSARFMGIDHQIDTYFGVDKGRLKLRQGDIENNLIYYHRENQGGPKKSDVLLYTPANDDALKEILVQVLGTKIVVDKQRGIYFIDNVKFHVDTVKGLGQFVEIEAIGEVGQEEELERQCRNYMTLLQISEDALIDRSYSDMLMERTQQ